ASPPPPSLPASPPPFWPPLASPSKSAAEPPATPPLSSFKSIVELHQLSDDLFVQVEVVHDPLDGLEPPHAARHDERIVGEGGPSRRPRELAQVRQQDLSRPVDLPVVRQE